MNLPKLPDYVTLVAAGKSRTVKQIEEAINSGVKIIGMNYVQEAEELVPKIKKVSWHLIGHLQSNKVKKAVLLFDMIQTVDSFKIAQLISKSAVELDKDMPVLIQINIAKEENKHGVYPEDVLNLAEEIIQLQNIKLLGLMTIGPKVSDLRPYFQQANEIFRKLQKKIKGITILSMGMSNSYKTAIQEGSTMVRLGTLLWGPRD